MNNERLERMHKLFGASPGQICGNCSHFHRLEYHDRGYFKCDVYGMTNSQASDWRMGYAACGMYDRPYTGRCIIEIREKRVKVCEQIQGQMNLLGGEENDA